MQRPIPTCPARHTASVSSHHQVLSSTHPHWTQPVVSKMAECCLPQLSILPTAVGQSENNMRYWKTARFLYYQPVLHLRWNERAGSTEQEVVCMECVQHRKWCACSGKWFACSAGSSLHGAQEAVCMECLHKLNLQLMKTDSNSFSV